MLNSLKAKAQVLLAKANKQNIDLEIIFNNIEELKVTTAKLKLEEVVSSNATKVSLRVGLNSAFFITVSDDLTQDSLNLLLQQAIEIVKVLPKNEFAGFLSATDIAKATQKLVNFTKQGVNSLNCNLELYDATTPTTQELLEVANTMEKVGAGHELIINSESSTGYIKNITLVTNSKGFEQLYKTSNFYNNVSFVAKSDVGTEMEWDYAFSYKMAYNSLQKASEVGRKALDNTLARLNPKKAKSGVYPVIFHKRVAKEILSLVANLANGYTLAGNKSFFNNKLNTKIFSENINIIDDPFIVQGLGSYVRDMEGVIPKKMFIIKNGILKNFLLDLESAKKLNLTSNGHGFRGLSSGFAPRISNFYLKASSVVVADLFQNLKTGYYITETMGMGTNLINGDYSKGASGFFFEEGKIIHAVNNLTIAGNLKTMFLEMQVANDLEFEGVINSPTIFFPNLTVSA